MGVNPGYQETELGIVPADWFVEPLGKDAAFRKGPFGSALHSSDYVLHGVPIVNPMHLIDGTIQPSQDMAVSESTAQRLTEFRVLPGEIVMGRRGDMGRCAVVRDTEAGWLCGTGSMIIRPRNAHPEFLQRVLSSRRVIEAIENASAGSTMVNLNQRTLSGLKIQFPPLPEQRAIATALSDVDALLEGLDRLIAKKRDLKQAAMQQLLTGQTRLPGFDGDWGERRVGEFGRVVTGGTPSTAISFYWGGECPWITPTDIDESRDISRGARGLTSIGIASVRELPANSVLVTCIASIGKNAILRRRGSCNQQINAVCPSSDYVAEFLYYLFEYNTEKLLARAGTTATPIISRASFERVDFCMPPTFSEQASIGEVLSDIDDEIQALEQRRAKTTALKQAMMQELLTGRTRLVEPSRSHKEAVSA